MESNAPDISSKYSQTLLAWQVAMCGAPPGMSEYDPAVIAVVLPPISSAMDP